MKKVKIIKTKRGVRVIMPSVNIKDIKTPGKMIIGGRINDTQNEKNKVTSVKNDNSCVSHKCTWCNRKLKVKTRKGDWIATAIVFIVFGTIITGLSYLQNVQDSSYSCYQRYVASGDVNGIAIYATKDVDCPKNVN